ncbi:primosomal protein N' [bacterium]|nr:primosomal protein N' [bacterium]
MIAKVNFSIPHSNSFDYLIPERLAGVLKTGFRVLVPFGPRTLIGVIVKILEKSEYDRLKTIIEKVDEIPIYDQRMLTFTKWISDYYLCSWGEVLDASLPTGLKPKIEKTIGIQKSNYFNDLEENQKNWLLSLDNMKQTTVLKITRDSAKKKLLEEFRKKGVIEYKPVFLSNFEPEEKEEWLVIQPDEAETLNTRKESKTSKILEILKREKRVRRKDMTEMVPSASSVIALLIKKGAIVKEMVNTTDYLCDHQVFHDRFISLNEEQRTAADIIREQIRLRQFQPFLLHGVTGSGKTEVYLHAVRETIEQGRTTLILIPEISLTPQAVSRFRERFGERVAVLHSGMKEKERCREWWNIKNQRCDIVIGARSAIFAPLRNIGLIVVDEEHDSSYKQQETPFYNSRDAAVKMASDENAVVILGSATPSVESYYNVEQEKYCLLTLPKRANQRDLPKVDVISLREEERQKGAFYLSRYLVTKLRETLDAEKQALLFLNRRGYSAFLSCKECELPVLCDNCSIAMTWHKTRRSLMCHHCGSTRSYPSVCSACGNTSFNMEGIGTQRIERDLKILFPQAKTLRMDKDTVNLRGSLERHIDSINKKEVDFIIGTQLISKGHDFKHIGIVCVVMADMSLNIPDFRSSERSFQLISQVSGRAGRDEKGEGLTLVQSYNPNHFAIRSACENDYSSFFKQEIEVRKILDNPPFTRQILLRISEKNPAHVQETALSLGEILSRKAETDLFQMLGPAESPIQKVNNRYFWQILLKSSQIGHLKKLLRYLFWIQSEWKPKGSTRVSIDVDPYSMI